VIKNSERGIVVVDSQQVKIINCTFLNNTKGHMEVSLSPNYDQHLTSALVQIKKSRFFNGTSIE
jgi:hypothetical protein